MSNSLALGLNLELVNRIFQAISQNGFSAAIKMLREFALESSQFPQKWLEDTAEALETQDWSILSEGFTSQNFIGRDGYFLIIAPYMVRREGFTSTKLTLIFGRIISVAHPPIEKMEYSIRKRFGVLQQEIPLILPYQQFLACGNVGNEEGEAFVVANGWDFPNSFRGPSLNDMTEQRRRFLDSGRKCIRRIWEPDTADLLLAALEDEMIGTRNRHWEYQFHDAGHATGLGIDRKIQENMFITYWYGGVEEWRSDGVEFELADSTLSSEEAGQVIAVNLCVRLALDAHRRGGMNRDGDVCASLLTFDRLFESGEIYIKDGYLSLREPSYRALLRAVEPHRQEAVRLTQEELNLDCSHGLFRLYGSVKYNLITEKIFKWLIIDRGEDLYSGLR